ncbi:protein unc-45 homolog B-like [Tubulanus polymorphus]|uniref:protein unc-45 homolog B-like n=1 Tax=Tubulanus polymorphus TaxID=672921 RepID=UPI003DA6C210
MKEVVMDADALKEKGNGLFKAGSFKEAIACYTDALKADQKDTGRVNLYKNLSACHLKLENYVDASNAATSALEISPHDPKALFRRCQAYEKLDKFNEAYKDAMHLLNVEPKNAAVQPILRRLAPILQEKIKKHTSTDSKVTQMFDVLLNADVELAKRITAANNLIVLAREESGAQQIYREGGVLKLCPLLLEKEAELLVSAIRTLACLAKDLDRALNIIKVVTFPKLFSIMAGNNEDITTATAHLMQNIMYAVSGFEKYNTDREKYNEEKRKDSNRRAPFPALKIADDNQAIIDDIFLALLKMLPSNKVSAYGRDAALELIIKNVSRNTDLGWTRKLLENKGIEKLMEVAGTIPELKALTVTPDTRRHTAVALHKIYEDTMSDRERDMFRDACNEFLSDRLGDEIMDSKYEAIVAVTTLLEGPYEIGQSVLAKEGIVEIMLAMANSNEILHQRIAVEALIQASSKKDKCSGIVAQAVPILKALYNSKNESIKVRALVGMCKLGSLGGTDASSKSLAEGSTLTLAKACIKFLKNPAKDVDLRRWATEGLAYLTLDADIKEEVVNDTTAVESIIDLSKIHNNKQVQYPATQIFVNLTNSYDKKDIMPEMLELAKFAKHHVPEEHEKDKEEFIKERIKKLVSAGVSSSLVALASGTESDNTKELIARVFLAIVTEQEHRGVCVQQGAAKVLLSLALKGTDMGRVLASQALAKIAITLDPKIAFPGQRSLEVVRPMIYLLHPDLTGLQNFEALMALTNLSSMNDSVRNRIVQEKGLSKIENYMFEDHEMLRKASTQCICNMVLNKDVQKLFCGENDRVKMLLLMCGSDDEDDEDLIIAASGALAILSAAEEEIVHRIMKVKSWLEVLALLCANERIGIQYRGVYIVRNIMLTSKECAQKLVESSMLEVLMAVSKLDRPDQKQARDTATEALKCAQDMGLIAPAESVEKEK